MSKLTEKDKDFLRLIGRSKEYPDTPGWYRVSGSIQEGVLNKGAVNLDLLYIQHRGALCLIRPTEEALVLMKWVL